MNVVQLPTRAAVVLTKRQLADHLGRSPRWIELRVREGMPCLEATDRYGRRRYDLVAVEAWLTEAKPKPHMPSVEDRLASLEHQVQQLLRRSA